MGYDVRPARPADVTACAEVLAQGFRDDPLHSFIWPDPGQRHRVLARFFAISLRYGHPLDGLWLARNDSGNAAAVACWHPPGWKQSRGAFVRSLPTLMSVLRTRIPAALAVQRAIDESHPNQPHWYLNTLASTAAERGTGAARLLLSDRLAECDRTRSDAYLVCTRDATISYYERAGFAVTAPVSVPGGPTFWGMLRKAGK